ncbi:MAG: hypothetical protein C4519_19180 [Desulfobacteraceae bacterium]|nr:MAG: hypothetical protein C4519_19180 [Desulfobacteraceae bacterium]
MPQEVQRNFSDIGWLCIFPALQENSLALFPGLLLELSSSLAQRAEFEGETQFLSSTNWLTNIEKLTSELLKHTQ